jgi:hypothetical protein
MFRSLVSLLRPLLVAVLLGFVTAASAEAGGRSSARSTARDAAYAEPLRAITPGDPLVGLLWIVFGIAVIVFVVWVCTKAGDTSRPSDGVIG